MKKIKTFTAFSIILFSAVLIISSCQSGDLPDPDDIQERQTNDYLIEKEETNRPGVKVSYPTNNAVITTPSFQVYGTADDDTEVDRVYISVSGSLFRQVNGSTNWNTNLSLQDGLYNLKFFSKDVHRNLSETNQIGIIVSIDDIYPPEISFSSYTNLQLIRTNAFPVFGKVIDNKIVDKIYISLSNDEFTRIETTENWSNYYSNIPNGFYEIKVYAVDTSQNTNTNSIQVEVYYDTTAPHLSFTSPETAYTELFDTNYYSVYGTVTDERAVSKVHLNISYSNDIFSEYQLLTNFSNSNIWMTNLSNLSNQTYQIIAYAEDEWGNLSFTNTSYLFVDDADFYYLCASNRSFYSLNNQGADQKISKEISSSNISYVVSAWIKNDRFYYFDTNTRKVYKARRTFDTNNKDETVAGPFDASNAITSVWYNSDNNTYYYYHNIYKKVYKYVKDGTDSAVSQIFNNIGSNTSVWGDSDGNYYYYHTTDKKIKNSSGIAVTEALDSAAADIRSVYYYRGRYLYYDSSSNIIYRLISGGNDAEMLENNQSLDSSNTLMFLMRD